MVLLTLHAVPRIGVATFVAAVICDHLAAVLAYLAFPADEGVNLRTTNPIERLNKELKRRTKPMEIVAGETSA